jgi:predicted nucleic-acid-binding Zn-ribbon protein
MRTTHRCPKCHHGEVLHIPEPKDTDHDRLALGGPRNVWTTTPNGQLEAYICCKCGYTELYADLGAIDVSKIAGARLLRAQVPDTPYR